MALEPLDGTVRWKYTPPGYVFAGMPALGEVLVVVSHALDGSRSWLEFPASFAPWRYRLLELSAASAGDSSGASSRPGTEQEAFFEEETDRHKPFYST